VTALLPGLPPVPEESWRRTAPEAFFLPPSEMLAFSGKPVLEALAQGARPWKIALEDTGSPEVQARVKDTLSSVLPASAVEALAALKAESTAFVFLEDGLARVVTPAAGVGRYVVEVSGAPADVHAVVGTSVIGAALAARLRATVPHALTVNIRPKGMQAEEALTLVVVAAGSPAYAQSWRHIRYVAAQGVKVDLLHVDGGASFAHHRHDVVVAPGAELNEAWIHVGAERNVDGHQLLERRVEVDAGATFRDALVFAPAGTVRVVSNVVLAGRKALAHGSAAVIASGGAIDYEPVQEHVGPGGTSDLMAKMIASGRGRAVFQGLVVVHKEAPGTDAVQLNKNLVLSKRARIDSLPRLEILPNEVSCKHGSATGEIDARQIYYLGTRGLSEEQARALVLQGFALEGIGALPSENVLFAVAEEVVTGLVARIAKV
jgi:Fe-S cluster assembly protein SufD